MSDRTGTSTEVRSAILKMGLPAAAAMFVGTLYAPIDLWCAGRLGVDAVVAVSFAAPLFFVLVAFASGLAQATTALIARQLGAGEADEARRTWAHALVLAVVVGGALAIMGIRAIPAMLAGQGATGEALRLSADFSVVLFGGAAAFLLVATINSALVAEGDTRTNFAFMVVGCLVNLGLNLLLMGRWGVAGLAASTVIVQLMGVFGLYAVARRRGWALGGLQALRPAIFRALLRQALPTMLNMLMIPVAIFLVTRQVAAFGAEAVAGYGFAARLEHLFTMPLIGLVTPILPLAARAKGAGDERAAFRVWLASLGIAFVAALGLALLLFVVGSNLGDWSGLVGPAKGHLERYLGFATLAMPAYPVLFSVVFFMQASGRPEYGMWMGLFRHCLAPLILLPVFVARLGLDGVWVAIAVIAWSAAGLALCLGGRERR